MGEGAKRLPSDAAELEQAIALVNAGDAETAIPLLDRLLANDAACAKGWCARGTAMRMLERFEEALGDYERALAIDPNYARAIFNRGLTRLKLGDAERAHADFELAMSLDPEPALFYHRGMVWLELRKHPEAIADFTACIERDATQTATFFHRGCAHAEMENREAAIEDFRQAIELDPDNGAARVWLAAQLAHLGRHQQAVAVLDAAIARAPNDGELFYRRGWVLYSSGDFEAAVRDVNRAISLGAQEAEHYYWRGRTWEKLHDFAAAIADQSEAIARSDDNFEALLSRGRSLLASDQPVAALEDFNAAIELQPQVASAWTYRAAAHADVGDDGRALADLDRALELDPKYERALCARSDLHVELGNNRLAEADLDALAAVEEGKIEEIAMAQRQVRISLLLADHFEPTPATDLAVSERQFPFRVRADLQQALDALRASTLGAGHFSGVKKEHSYEGLGFADLLFPNSHDPALAVPAQYEEVDIGEETAVRCLKNGLWLSEKDGARFGMLLTPKKDYGRATGMEVQIAVPAGEVGSRLTQELFQQLEEAVFRSQSYRGKILSLEQADRYSGKSGGILVHKLRTVERSQVILPAATIELLDRNVIQFAQQRARLAELGLSTKKGVLFYGPPGTGKTHTIHYLAGALEGHTTILITAEQVANLGEYMTLARLLQPSMVVIEDADLIARDRGRMDSPCEEALLNKLLNEMDGLRPDTDVFFILTTNRPEALEGALAGRPGRIDQAIEFPLPDDVGRRKLVRLYGKGLTVPEQVVDMIVARTERVSASFIKELMRRAAQFQLERDGVGALSEQDVERSLEEMLFAGGALNCRLLGMHGKE
jgi:cell division protease FtsH